MPQMIFSVKGRLSKKMIAVYSMVAPDDIFWEKKSNLVSCHFIHVMNKKEGGSNYPKISIVILWPYVPSER